MKRKNFFTPATLLRRVSLVALSTFALALAACGDDPTGGGGSGSGSGSGSGTEDEIDEIVEWMDGRLKKEYMWLDEYIEKHSTFDMSLAWDKFLDKTLAKLTTNADDGGESDGERTFYSYVDRKKTSTAAATTRAGFPVEKGYGIELTPYILSKKVVLNYLGDGPISSYDDSNYFFVIDHVYPASSADDANIKRGDVIVEINGAPITDLNYARWWTSLQTGEDNLTLKMYTRNDDARTYEFFDCELPATNFERNPIAYGDLLTIDSDFPFDLGDKKIGYLSYLSFDWDFDEKMVEAISTLVEKGATDVILDLRSNGGGHVTSSVLLASMLLDESYVGPDKIYARLVHNPNNKIYDDEELTLQNRYTPKDSSASVDLPNLGLKKVWIICSEFSASASEMVIVGLRGLDVEVELVGNITEGKNCGMEVTYKTHDGYKYEFAPITFMNQNGKGFSDYGEGITPEHNLAAKAADKSFSDGVRTFAAYFPIPVTSWGDLNADIALCETVMQICGETLFIAGGGGKSALFEGQPTTRAIDDSSLKHTAIRMEKQDLKSRGMIVRGKDSE